MSKIILGIAGAFVLLVVIVAVAAVGAYNGLVNRSQAVDAQWAQVQNVYQRRADLIPNLVNTVSGAANFEKSTLTEITEARASVGRVQMSPNAAPADPAQLAQFEQAQGQLGSALSRLLASVGVYGCSFSSTMSVYQSPSFLNRFFTSLKWNSSEQSFSSSPGLKCFATAGSAFRTSTKLASSRPACLTSHVFIAASWTSL